MPSNLTQTIAWSSAVVRSPCTKVPTHVFRRKAQFLGVHELHARAAAGRDHLVGFGQRSGERLLANDMLSRLRCGYHYVPM